MVSNQIYVYWYIFSRRQQLQKHVDGTANTTVVPDNQNIELTEIRNHQEVVTQLSSPAVDQLHNGTGGVKPVTRNASKGLYCDMNKIPRQPADEKAGVNSTESTSSKAGSQTRIPTTSCGLYASVRKLSARLARGKARTPRTREHLYDNVGTSSIYCNV